MGEHPIAARRGPIRIGNAQDFYGGLALVALALVALWALRELPGMRGLRFGPGTAPRLFAGALAVVGGVVSVMGLLTRGHTDLRYAIRGPLLVTLSILVFAGMIRPLGVVVSTFVTVLVAATASPQTRWGETVVWAAILAGGCTLLFRYALNLSLPVWPRF